MALNARAATLKIFADVLMKAEAEGLKKDLKIYSIVNYSFIKY